MRFGMSDRLGHLTYGAPQNAQFLRLPFVSEERNYSEKTPRRSMPKCAGFRMSSIFGQRPS